MVQMTYRSKCFTNRFSSLHKSFLEPALDDDCFLAHSDQLSFFCILPTPGCDKAHGVPQWTGQLSPREYVHTYLKETFG